VENFRFFELKVYALADPERVVANDEQKPEGQRAICVRLFRFRNSRSGFISPTDCRLPDPADLTN